MSSPDREPRATPALLHHDCRAVLRGIRDELGGDCTYRGSDAEAARLSAVSELEAATALHRLATAGLIRLDRRA